MCNSVLAANREFYDDCDGGNGGDDSEDDHENRPEREFVPKYILK